MGTIHGDQSIPYILLTTSKEVRGNSARTHVLCNTHSLNDILHRYHIFQNVSQNYIPPVEKNGTILSNITLINYSPD